ncbi:MAG: jacalin-like lectin [Chloroflexota bacterium]|nr:jacalin-like lectin [Chloroflexota bacterium]
MSNRMKCGPSGGIGGKDFVDPLPPAKVKIKEILVCYKDAVEAIQITWSDSSKSDKHGKGNTNPTSFPLDDDEYLVSISGRYGETLDKITLITSKGKETSFGGEGGDVEFFYNVDPAYSQAHIIGFFGRADDAIDAIGCIFSVEE